MRTEKENSMPGQRQIEHGKKVVPPSTGGDQEMGNIASDVANNSALDALLDEIDRTLEEQGDLAEKFVQRSGE